MPLADLSRAFILLTELVSNIYLRIPGDVATETAPPSQTTPPLPQTTTPPPSETTPVFTQTIGLKRIPGRR